jgi:hypothetical protein
MRTDACQRDLCCSLDMVITLRVLNVGRPHAAVSRVWEQVQGKGIANQEGAIQVCVYGRNMLPTNRRPLFPDAQCSLRFGRPLTIQSAAVSPRLHCGGCGAMGGSEVEASSVGPSCIASPKASSGIIKGRKQHPNTLAPATSAPHCPRA